MTIQLLERSNALIQGHGPWIAGQSVANPTGGVHAHVNPATGAVQAELALAGVAEVESAVAAARGALAGWRAVPAHEKARILMRWVDLMDRDGDELALITAREIGIPFKAGMGAGFAGLWMRYFAGWCDKIEGQVVHSSTLPGFSYILPEPYGVIAAVMTWNSPIPCMAMKVVPALAAGNCVVMKTAEFASFGAARMCRLAQEAGLPPGVLNLIPGGPAAGEALVRHSDVDKISFTGGLATARHIMAGAAQTIRPMAMELGGKSANIVFADADLATIFPGAVLGAFALTGQGCVNPTRLLVHESRYEEIVAGLVDVVGKQRIGDPLDSATDLGPVVNKAAHQRILGVIDQARAQGAGRVVIGGGAGEGDLAPGYFIQPTVFADVDPDSSLATEEIFGPVLSVIKFQTDEEALRIANQTDFGLGAYLHTRDIDRAHRMAAALEAGYICINSSMAPMSPTMPFGGIRDSGFGREGGRAGIEEFIRPKNIFVSMIPR